MNKKILKVQKEMPEFVSEVEGLSIEQAEKRLADLAKSLEEVDESKEDNVELAAAREHLAMISAPYREAKQAIRLKTSYLVHLVREKGGE